MVCQSVGGQQSIEQVVIHHFERDYTNTHSHIQTHKTGEVFGVYFDS